MANSLMWQCSYVMLYFCKCPLKAFGAVFRLGNHGWHINGLLLAQMLRMVVWINRLNSGSLSRKWTHWCGSNFTSLFLNSFYEVISWALPVKLVEGEPQNLIDCKLMLMPCAVRQQAITWMNVDPDLTSCLNQLFILPFPYTVTVSQPISGLAYFHFASI